jgi:hypothetical protein
LDTSKTAQVGYWLRAHKNRLAGGLKLVMTPVNGGKLLAKWELLQSGKAAGGEMC